ncbi:unnamed protein product [Euphydryas editha]|uniref:HAT C-terminal dimerisation domain-containing protein n=1 Tax=Euphydryas editha TaxID=104508 RepID=A0AAU9TEX5_EUPED|nr:unnamed protein product [Euphydryas editha]
MIQNFKDFVASGARFSLSVDEWTSVRNRRYFNLCLHGKDGEVFNLGLIYIPGKCGAGEARKIVDDALIRFKLDFEKNIVATTSDGPNVMKKFGRESPSEMILCMNHAIHLGVVDTFFKKKEASTTFMVSSCDDSDNEDEFIENSTDDETDYQTNYQPIDEIKRVLDETRFLVAEAIIDVLLKKIQSTTTNNDLGKRFFETLKVRLEERRPQRVVCLLKYLHTGHHTSQSQNTDFFTSNISKTSLIGFAEELYCRLFENIPSIRTPDVEIMDTEPSTSCSDVNNEPDKSFVNQMEQAIKNIQENVPEIQKTTTRATLKKEFQLFEATGKRTESLELLYTALNTIKPTSVENERVFSLSGGIITKIRNRLSDKAVDALIFLKAYFIKLAKKSN